MPEDIKDDIEALRDKSADNLVLEYMEKELELGRQGKIVLLDQYLNQIGESLLSFRALDQEEQQKAVKCVEAILNPYFQGAEKESAKKELENIFG